MEKAGDADEGRHRGDGTPHFRGSGPCGQSPGDVGPERSLRRAEGDERADPNQLDLPLIEGACLFSRNAGVAESCDQAGRRSLQGLQLGWYANGRWLRHAPYDIKRPFG